MYKTFSDLVREYRINNGMSYRQMAEKLGIDHSVIYNWEKGSRYPRPHHLKTIAEALEMEPIELHDLIEREKESKTKNEEE